MWSLVIAKDLFAVFDRDNLLAPECSRRYRDTILAAGGSSDATELVSAFKGSAYNIEAFTRWLQEPPTDWVFPKQDPSGVDLPRVW
jgi:thimet oligopeptidase